MRTDNEIIGLALFLNHMKYRDIQKRKREKGNSHYTFRSTLLRVVAQIISKFEAQEKIGERNPSQS